MRYIFLIFAALSISSCAVKKATDKFCECIEPVRLLNEKAEDAQPEEAADLVDESMEVLKNSQECSEEFKAEWGKRLEDIDFKAKVLYKMQSRCPENYRMLKELNMLP